MVEVILQLVDGLLQLWNRHLTISILFDMCQLDTYCVYIKIYHGFSVAKATLQPPMSTKDVVILNQGCGYIQKDVVI